MKYFTPGNMPTLKLTLTKKWFDLILSGEKREEYREIKDYWFRRLCYLKEEFDDPQVYEELLWLMIDAQDNYLQEYLDGFGFNVFPFEVVEFTNGYGAHRPRFSMKIKSIEIRYGDPGLGAPEFQRCFVIVLDGEPFDLKNL